MVTVLFIRSLLLSFNWIVRSVFWFCFWWFLLAHVLSWLLFGWFLGQRQTSTILLKRLLYLLVCSTLLYAQNFSKYNIILGWDLTCFVNFYCGVQACFLHFGVWLSICGCGGGKKAASLFFMLCQCIPVWILSSHKKN